MERFPNFPQTIDPVESETILEQFLELNNNVEKINQVYNEIAPQVDTNTTDIAQLKTQVSESGTRVKINGQLVAEWSPDVLSSDVATNTEDIEQIRLAQSSDSLAIVGLQSDNITNKQNISSLQSDNITNKQNISNLQGDVSELSQELPRALKTPMSAPTTTEFVGVDSTNSQVMINVKRYPVEVYFSELTWYIIYNDGWKECGQFLLYDESIGAGGQKSHTITFPITFNTNNYGINVTNIWYGSNGYVLCVGSAYPTRTTSGCEIGFSNPDSASVAKHACYYECRGY